MAYDVNAIRQSLKKTISGKFSDPDEFRPEKAKNSIDPIRYRFFILPPLKTGDQLKTGAVKQSMDNFFVRHGQHWVNERPHPCPRVYDGSECAICSYGFQLLQECKDKKYGDDRKNAILRQWMPSTYYMVNIFFTNWKGNPEDLRNKVKWYNAPKTCVDKWTSTLMRDDKGDEEDPDAFGIFFDENAAFCFELAVLKEGKSNSYKTSSFIKNNGVPVPMVKNADETPNPKAIDLLLKSRSNLWEKVEVPEPAKIQRLASQMISGDDDDAPSLSSGGFDADETKEPTAPAPKAVEPKAKQVIARKPATVVEEDDEAPSPARKEVPLQKAEPKRPVPAEQADDDSDDMGSEDIDALLKQLDD